jgi:hypothetical protein
MHSDDPIDHQAAWPRGRDRARAVADGKLNNTIEATGRDETASCCRR